MAGQGTISVNQTPQYGDKAAIDKLKNGMTETPMSGTPTPKPTAGRPAAASPTPGAAPAAPGEAAPQRGVPPEHQSLMDTVAEALRTKQFWDNVLQQSPSEWSRMYAAEATKAYQKAALALRNNTPFFEE